MDNKIDYPWIGEMFIYIIHGAVHYPWMAKMQNSIIHGYCKINLNTLCVNKLLFIDNRFQYPYFN